MKKSEWSDEQLKELLSQMPKIKDERDPREIYQNITIRMNKRKQRTWIMPSAAAALAAVLFFILVPNLFNWQSSEEQVADLANQSESSQKISMKENADLQETEEKVSIEEENAIPYTAEQNPEVQDKMEIRSLDMEDLTTAVYEEDIGGMEVLTYAIPDEKAMMAVPVSVLVAKEEDKTKFDLFEENMMNLNEKEWGLKDYFPLKAEFMLDEQSKVLTVDFPVDHPYGDGSAAETVFNVALSYTLSALDISEIKFTTDGKPGMDLGNSGVIEEFIPEYGNHAYYFYYPNETVKKPYIVPYGEKFSSISEALAAMKENQEKAKLFASIPDDINFETEVNQEEKKLTIHFGEGSVINNDESTLHTIEAILLTAKDFNYQAVKMENAKVEMVGRFNLTEEIKVPVAANKRSLP
ncbi:GerMN domain-containing protein [Cytobacillus solani]|uniref:Negative regulator of sigma-X activity n=1 Tax=Cytobacillus solani TaxID=1637975 RepID=A0A0Q3QQ73_9BACI|nr:GerMN domain-containing protein [Cytobacillus solani]KOP83286.1 hypothetical protein AMS60_12830 [Bacillus sp. FJAT-21945]KQL20313.1 hypothetical protein AN957_18140 [Cytobacillus solani]USK53570.1 GerMN domain-containing protein [Cytobacillus solani]